MPKLTSHEDTILYLYYGNPEATDQQNVNDVWSNQYLAVFHMNGDPAEGIRDATTYNHVGTTNGGMTKSESLRPGLFGEAIEFDGTNDYIEVAHRDTVDFSTTESFSLQLWIQAPTQTSASNETKLIGKRAGSGWYQLQMIEKSRPTLEYNGGANLGWYNNTPQVTNNAWHQVTATVDRGAAEAKRYVDAGSIVSSAFTADVSNTANVVIGRWNSNNNTYKGKMDEIRISSVARSGDWISTEYANQCDCEDFLTIAPLPETAAAGTSTITLKPTHALPFTSLSTFTANTHPQTTFQLSNNAGTSWLFYTQDGWKSANPLNPLHRSSSNDITSHLSSFPQGAGKLTWRAYLPSGATLDSIKIDYTAGTPSPTFSSLITPINDLFNQVYGRIPTKDEWTYWADRITQGDKTTLPAIFGAMQWQRLFGG